MSTIPTDTARKIFESQGLCRNPQPPTRFTSNFQSDLLSKINQSWALKLQKLLSKIQFNITPQYT